MARIMSGPRRERFAAVLVLVLGGALGGVMVWTGFLDRVLGRYPSTLSGFLGVPGWIALGIPRATITWTLICLGLFWWGAVCAFAMRPRWGWVAVVMFAAPSLFFAPAGTVAAIVLFLLAAASRYLGGAASS
jgi:hypothetical protein